MNALMGILLDRSGSMSGKELDVVGGVNRFIDDQKKVDGEASLLMARFDKEYELFRPLKPLAEVSPLESTEYAPRGYTALLDALGKTIGHFDQLYEEKKPDKVIVVVATDGLENASREFNRELIKSMIAAREKDGVWTFIYIGAHVQAFDEARSMGFQMSNTSQVHDSHMGSAIGSSTMNAGVRSLRTGATQNAGLGRDVDILPDLQQLKPKRLSNNLPDSKDAA